MTWQDLDTACPCCPEYSEILYVVFITIKCPIKTLYVVFVLHCLHLSIIVINRGAHVPSGEKI